MLIGNTFIRNGKVILKDVSGEEVELTPEDTLDLLQWIYERHSQLQSLTAHKPPMFTREQTLKSVQQHKEGE